MTQTPTRDMTHDTLCHLSMRRHSAEFEQNQSKILGSHGQVWLWLSVAVSTGQRQTDVVSGGQHWSAADRCGQWWSALVSGRHVVNDGQLHTVDL